MKVEETILNQSSKSKTIKASTSRKWDLGDPMMWMKPNFCTVAWWKIGLESGIVKLVEGTKNNLGLDSYSIIVKDM